MTHELYYLWTKISGEIKLNPIPGTSPKSITLLFAIFGPSCIVVLLLLYLLDMCHHVDLLSLYIS